MSENRSGGSVVGMPDRSEFVNRAVDSFAATYSIDEATAANVKRYILEDLFVGDETWREVLEGRDGAENYDRARAMLTDGLNALLDPDVRNAAAAGSMASAFSLARGLIPGWLERCQHTFPCAP